MADLGLCAAVLAGGESRRFGSEKALAPFRGGTLLATVLGSLAGAGAPVAVVARDAARAARLQAGVGDRGASVTWLIDLSDPPGLRGPLAGVAAALAWAPGPTVFLCAADMPWAGRAVAPLAQCLAGSSSLAAAVAHDGERSQVLCALVRTDAARGALARCLAEGRRSMHAFLAALSARELALDGAARRACLDADTPDALAGLEALPEDERESPGSGQA